MPSTETASLDTGQLKKFAQAARTSLMAQVGVKLKRVLTDGSMARRENADTVEHIEKLIEQHGTDHLVERVAYTWFNRFIALRYMDINGYTRVGIVSPTADQTQPEILGEAKMGHLDDEIVTKTKRIQISDLLDGTTTSSDPQGEAYRLLLVAACNHYHKLMPFMFERIADYTELLLPDDLLSANSILTAMRETLTELNCSPDHTDQSVEVIGWLYQFYISEKKDDVFAALKKGKKITPENIPAATQLFTPHWIVRYLVENSLGRLWMLNHPDSRLAEQMDYYIRPEEPAESTEEGDFLRISSPEEIKICDPACGSGHMLTYAFDLLYAIYEEQGYQATDIPRLILTHNLYGIEIDQRAGALAAFALTMKAREKYRRFLTGGKVVQPNICVLENVKIDPEDLSAYMDKVGRDLFSGGLQGVVNQWEEADNFGSLIRPLVTDVSEVLELLRERQMGEDLFLAGVHQKVLKALRQADYLSPKYHVVVANPPYMGRRNMNLKLKKHMQGHFDEVKTDVFAAFIIRNMELCLPKGQLGFMAPFVWMFISSYEKLREYLLDEKAITSLVQLEYSGFDGATVPICTFTLENFHRPDLQGGYVKLSEFKGSENQSPRTLEAIRNPDCGWFYRAKSSDFRMIPAVPISFWLPRAARQAFVDGTPLSEIAEPRQGMATTDNNQFLRLWGEVSFKRIGFGCDSLGAASESKRRWFPYNKGGNFRRWYGNLEYLVDYEDDGKRLKEVVKEKYRDRDYAQGFTEERWDKLIEVWVLKNQEFYFRPCITWSFISSAYFGVRQSDAGFIFDVGGSSAFPPPDRMQDVTSFLCSRVAFFLMKGLNPTLNFQVENVAALPLLEDPLRESRSEFDRIANSAISISREDWNSSEMSWSFQRHNLLESNGTTLAEKVNSLRTVDSEKVTRLKEIEEENNSLLIEIYGLTEHLTSDVDLAEVSINCNPAYRYDEDKSESELEALLLADTMREFISYAVGCMLGRYSLDKPGLILANQGETADDYRQQIPEPTFAFDEDNVIPLLDGDWFTDDISERFKEFLKVTFGTEHYEENLTFLENSLFPANLEGKKRKTIRDYFLKEFYNHHIKLYKKRPIYWMFSSPKGTFNALIYMHRYRPDTVSVVLNDYLREFQTKLSSKIESLQHLADSADAATADKTRALKEIVKLKKQVVELQDYEKDILFPLAQQQVEIDLDDGVKENYNKLGKALKKVTGLTGKA